WGINFNTLRVTPSPCRRSTCRSRSFTALSCCTNWASGATWMSRGPSQGRPRSWATWAWIWANVACSAGGTAAVVVVGGAVVDVVGALVLVDGDDVDVAEARTFPPPLSPARMAITATRGAGTRIAAHRTGALSSTGRGSAG